MLRFEQPHGFLRIGRRETLITRRPQDPHPALGYIGLVVENEDSLCRHQETQRSIMRCEPPLDQAGALRCVKHFESGSYDAEGSSVGSVMMKVVPFPGSD